MRTIIIDSHLMNRLVLKKNLEKYHPDVKIVAEASGVSDGLVLIERHKPDFVFLEVKLEGGTGFDLLDKIKNRDFEVVFITALDEYAIEAIKYGAIDYILKPYEINNLTEAIEKVKLKQSEKVRRGMVGEILYQFSTNISDNPIKLLIDNADAPPDEIADFLSELSILYRMMGGSGINFELEDVLQLKAELA